MLQGAFGRNDTFFQPAFVFSNTLDSGYPKYVWEAGKIWEAVAGSAHSSSSSSRKRYSKITSDTQEYSAVSCTAAAAAVSAMSKATAATEYHTVIVIRWYLPD